MPTIHTRTGVQLFVKDWGKGKPVIMLHGWPLSADTFDDLAMAVAGAGMRAIAYDRRGFGRSEQPWGPYDYDTLADDLADVIEATGADHDLHSGVYGGVAPNPLQAVAEILAGLKDRDGRILIPGFYDRVRRPSQGSSCQSPRIQRCMRSRPTR